MRTALACSTKAAVLGQPVLLSEPGQLLFQFRNAVALARCQRLQRRSIFRQWLSKGERIHRDSIASGYDLGRHHRQRLALLDTQPRE